MEIIKMMLQIMKKICKVMMSWQNSNSMTKKPYLGFCKIIKKSWNLDLKQIHQEQALKIYIINHKKCIIIIANIKMSFLLIEEFTKQDLIESF